MGRRTLVLATALAAAFAFSGMAYGQEAPVSGVPPAVPVIAEGVTINGVAVGGMSAVEAKAAVQAAFNAPLEFKFRKQRWTAAPAKLGARAMLNPAIGRALGSAPGTAVELEVRIGGKKLRKYVAQQHAKHSSDAVDSELKLVKFKPRYTKAKNGYEIDKLATTKEIITALKSHGRSVKLAYEVIEPEVTPTSKSPIVVVKRDSKKLFLYNGKKLVRAFRVAVGQSAYPTPLGSFEVVNKQVNPTWIPPDSDWAQGLSPVGPGPGNPLGTRWMGISSPLIGIHGTYDVGSIGTNASHGCIRMNIGEVEWLFERLDVGTPIWVVGA